MRQLIIFAITCFTAAAGNAQFYNGGVFYIGNTGILSVNTTFTNTTNGSFRNDGTIYITGNVGNSQTSMPAGTGTTVFNGTSNQQLTGTAPYRNLNITLDNAAGLTLVNRLAIGDGVAGTLTFTAGGITSGTNTEDVYFYPGSAYTGYDAAHHIIGYCTKSGSTAFDFPIGDGTHTADLAISGLTGTADFQVLYTGSGYGTYTTTSPIVNNGIYAQEWWDLHQTAGAVSAQVSLNWNDARKTLNHTNPGALVVAHYTGSIWISAGGTSTSSAGSSTGTVGPSNPLNTFSPFTFGSTATPLPITLGTFTAIDQNCQALLSWTTTHQSDAATFDIQASPDGINFNTLHTLTAQNTDSTYQITVAQQTAQTFYRLRMTAIGGAVTYSGIDVLDLPCLPSSQHLLLYPNPLRTNSMLQARLTSPDNRGMATLQIFDGSGKRVFSKEITVNNGVNTYSVAVSNLAQGVYKVLVVGDGWRSDVITFSRTGN